MLSIRRGEQRGASRNGWLDSRHTFSFADYYDPRHMGYSVLRVLNEDRVAPGAGFPPHEHRDMEIVSYVLEGALQHKDNLGNGSIIRTGEVQRMSAGTGILHSEYNASASEPVHFVQIWIVPRERGIEPEYEQKRLDNGALSDGMRLVASPDGRDGSLTLHQDAFLYVCRLGARGAEAYRLDAARNAYLQVVRGSLVIAGEELAAGDGGTLTGPAAIGIESVTGGELLLFDLP
jgi:quercetin 2,3-dioxygenase